MIPTLRSLPDPLALRNHLAGAYDLPFTTCTLLRSLVNDVYELTTPDDRYILKLYRVGGWEPAEILWETGLSTHLADAGLPIPRPHLLADGNEAGLLDAAEGERPFVLSEFVTGTKPRPPFTDDLYSGFGRLVARFHAAADTFSSPNPRRPSDLHRRLDEPLAQIRPFLAAAEENLLLSLADAVRNNLTQYSRELSWGVCHGDVSLDNVLITDDGLTLHDFDLSAEGFRAADFTGVAATEHWPAFLRGYREQHPISAADLAAIPYLAVVGRIFNLGFHLIGKPLIRGTESRGEGWAEGELSALRGAADELL